MWAGTWRLGYADPTMGPVPDHPAMAVALGGEMGERIAAFDWEAHPFGPLENWPARMRSIVAATLAGS